MRLSKVDQKNSPIKVRSFPPNHALRRSLLAKTQVDQLIEFIKILTNPTRFRVLHVLLIHGGLSLKQISSHLEAKPQGIWNQLAKLTKAGWVKSRNDREWRIVYSLVDQNGAIGLIFKTMETALIYQCLMTLCEKDKNITEKSKRRFLRIARSQVMNP